MTEHRGWSRPFVPWLCAAGILAAGTGSGAAEPAATCSSIEGIDSLLAAGRIVLVGEMHGTEQSPAFVADAVCAALARGLAVTVALEIRREEQGRIDAFLDSAGSAADRAALLAGPFWRGSFQDGRESAGELALLDAIRRERRGGAPVRVALLDQDARGLGIERDTLMAGRLRAAAAARPADLVIALTGNLHSRISRGSLCDPGFEPMGLVLARLLPERRITALDVAHTGGTAWLCSDAEPSSCHVHELTATPRPGTGRKVVLDPGLRGSGYDGYYTVGRLTASPPAVGAPSPGAVASWLADPAVSSHDR